VTAEQEILHYLVTLQAQVPMGQEFVQFGVSPDVTGHGFTHV